MLAFAGNPMIWYGKQLVARLIYLPAIIAAQVTSLALDPTRMTVRQQP